MGAREEDFGASEGTQAKLAPLFQAVEHALDNVTGFVEVDVVFELNFTVFALGNAGDCFSFRQPVTQVICVIATIRDDSAPLGSRHCLACVISDRLPAVRCK